MKKRTELQKISQPKIKWIANHIGAFQSVLQSKGKPGLVCMICGNDSKWKIPNEQPEGDNISIVCGSCGFYLEFHQEVFEQSLNNLRLKGGDNE